MPLFSASTNTVEFPNKKPEEINTLVLKTLDKLGSAYVPQQKTTGFLFRYMNPLFNLYPFDIYIGEYNEGSMVRIESVDNTNNALLNALSTEAYGTKFPITHHQKSVILGDLLTLILPAAGNVYVTLDSPFNMKLSWILSFLYLGIDGGLLLLGGTTFFTHSFDPLNKGLPATLILMGSYRAAHLIFNHISITGHTRMIQIGYTFQFDS